MKRVLMLVLLALPVMAMAQKPTKSTRSLNSQEVSTTSIPKLYGEIMMTEQQGRPVVRIIFDSASGKLIQDKQMRIDMEALKSYRFGSVLEAVNTLSAMGWTIGESYVWEARTGNELHIAFSKPSPKMMTPDLTKKDAGKDAGKGDAKGGRK